MLEPNYNSPDRMPASSITRFTLERPAINAPKFNIFNSVHSCRPLEVVGIWTDADRVHGYRDIVRDQSLHVYAERALCVVKLTEMGEAPALSLGTGGIPAVMTKSLGPRRLRASTRQVSKPIGTRNGYKSIKLCYLLTIIYAVSNQNTDLGHPFINLKPILKVGLGGNKLSCLTPMKAPVSPVCKSEILT